MTGVQWAQEYGLRMEPPQGISYTSVLNPVQSLCIISSLPFKSSRAVCYLKKMHQKYDFIFLFLLMEWLYIIWSLCGIQPVQLSCQHVKYQKLVSNACKIPNSSGHLRSKKREFRNTLNAGWWRVCMIYIRHYVN